MMLVRPVALLTILTVGIAFSGEKAPLDPRNAAPSISAQYRLVEGKVYVDIYNHDDTPILISADFKYQVTANPGDDEWSKSASVFSPARTYSLVGSTRKEQKRRTLFDYYSIALPLERAVSSLERVRITVNVLSLNKVTRAGSAEEWSKQFQGVDVEVEPSTLGK